MVEKLKVTKEIIIDAYEISKTVYERKLLKAEGIKILSENNRMNSGTANFYITIFDRMMHGENYTRTVNVASMEYFLTKIHSDFGKFALSLGLLTLQQHITYFESGHKGKMKKMREVFQRYSLINDPDEKEQSELVEYFKENHSRNEIIYQLKNLKETDPEIITINHKYYKRDSESQR